MVLTLYYDAISQPCRSIEMFMRLNNIPHAVKEIVFPSDNITEKYRKINPLGTVPFMDHDGFRFSESGAMMKYLITQFDIPEHWYPRDPRKRALVDEAIAWSHSAQRSIRHFSLLITCHEVFNPLFKMGVVNEEKAKKDVAGFHMQASFLEDVFLKDKPFVNSDEITIADIAISSELMDLVYWKCGVVEEHPKLMEYLERVRQKTNPCWDEIYKECREKARELEKVPSQMPEGSNLGLVQVNPY